MNRMLDQGTVEIGEIQRPIGPGRQKDGMKPRVTGGQKVTSGIGALRPGDNASRIELSPDHQVAQRLPDKRIPLDLAPQERAAQNRQTAQDFVKTRPFGVELARERAEREDLAGISRLGDVDNRQCGQVWTRLEEPVRKQLLSNWNGVPRKEPPAPVIMHLVKLALSDHRLKRGRLEPNAEIARS
jgi:hypothetical protein